MANSTIPGLVAVSVPALTDLFGVRQSGDARDKKLTATQLQALIGGGGDVTASGSPVTGEIPVWTGATDIKGSANDFVYNGAVFKVVCSQEMRLTGDLKLQTGSGQAPLLRDVLADETTPTLCPAVADTNTGIGWKSADRLAFIAGGKRAMVLAESNSIGVIPAYDTGTGLTAFAGGGQASAITLDRGYNVVTTVATTADSAKLPDGLAFLVGSVVYLKNNGANSLDLFPASGDDLGAGTDTAISVAAGASVAFIGTAEGSTWTQLIFAAGGGGGDVFKVGTPANNQLGVWTGDGTIEGDTNWQVVGSALQGAGGSSPEMRNVGGVNIHPRKGDTDTGLSSGGDNRLQMVAQGVVGIKLIGAAAAILQVHDTRVGLTAFAGGGAGSATQLNASYSVISTVATTGDSVKFSTTLEVGLVNYVKNDGANALDLFPAGGDDLGLGVGVAISVPAGASVAFIGTVTGSVSTQFIFAGGGIAAVVDDPSPQLGGDLDTNGSNIFNADTTLTSLSITAGTDPADEGGDLDLSSGDSGVGATGDAGAVNILAGESLATNGAGGVLSIKSGAGIGTGAGGDILVEVGEGGAPGPGTSGNLFINTLTGANAAAGLQVPLPGLVSIYGIGRSGEGPAGNLELWGGYANGTGGGSIGGDAIMWGGGQGGGTGVGGNARLIGGESDNNPGFVEIKGGTATVDGQGGQVKILGGPGFGTNRSGGNVEIDGGLGIGTGSGQRVDITGGVSGSGATGNGGNLQFFGGSAASTNGSGGDILLGGGTATGSGVQGTVDIDNGSLLRIVGPVNTNHVSMAHDNTDMNWIGTSTTDWNISGITALNAGSMDANVGRLILPSGSSAGAPELKIGSGQTGFFTGSATQLRVTINGTERFTITNDIIQGFLAGSGQLHNRVSSATVPTFTPNTNDGDTGIGRAGTDQLSLIAGGDELVRLQEVVGANQIILTPGLVDNNAALPTLAFGDGDTGFFEFGDDIMALSLSGTQHWRWQTTRFGPTAVSNAPSMQAESATATNPTLVPSVSDTNTGIGWTGTDQLALIAGALDCMTVRETGGARQIGFYTTAPISQQTGVAVTDVAIHAALVALGLITA